MVICKICKIYDVPHHGRIEPSNPKGEQPESESPMVNFKGPITRLRAKFVNLVTYLDNEEAFGSLEGNESHFRGGMREMKILARHKRRGMSGPDL